MKKIRSLSQEAVGSLPLKSIYHFVNPSSRLCEGKWKIHSRPNENE